MNVGLIIFLLSVAVITGLILYFTAFKNDEDEVDVPGGGGGTPPGDDPVGPDPGEPVERFNSQLSDIDLTEVDGIGETTSHIIQEKFDSVNDILEASDEEIQSVPRVTEEVQSNLEDFLKN